MIDTLLTLLVAIGLLGALDVAAVRLGIDSRPGVGDDHRR